MARNGGRRLEHKRRELVVVRRLMKDVGLYTKRFVRKGQEIINFERVYAELSERHTVLMADLTAIDADGFDDA